jgi:hypothetical protein
MLVLAVVSLDFWWISFFAIIFLRVFLLFHLFDRNN